MTDPRTAAGTTNTPKAPCYLRQAQRSSNTTQRTWIRSVLREAAASALRNIVTERTLQRRRERAEARQYDDGSISSIEDEPTESAGRSAADSNEGEEIEVTQADIDAAYAFAGRVGRRWAECLRQGQEGHDGMPSSADIALEVVRAGKYLEDDEVIEEENVTQGVDAEGQEETTADDQVAMEMEDKAVNDSESASMLSNLAKASDALTPEVTISRLVTPPALLIGNSPFGTLADEIPANPVLSASLATTMINTSADEIKAKNDEADAWRRNVAQQMGDLIENNRWIYPKELLHKAVQYNHERMASSRIGASTAAETASGRKLPSSVEASADTNVESDSETSAGSTGRKRKRSEINERLSGPEKEAPTVPRPPCSYSELEWTSCELSKDEQRKLDEELLHEIPEADNDGDAGASGERLPPPLPPSCIVAGYLHHFGSTQLWEKAGAKGSEVRVPNPMEDVGKAKRRRKRLYRQAKTERLGYRVERPNDARLEIDARLSKVVKATDGEKEEEEEGGVEYFEMDLGGCLLQVEGDDGTQRIVAFKSLEVSLSLNADGA